MMKRKQWLVHLILSFGALSMILPFLWMLLTSGKTLQEATAIPPTIFPKTVQVSN